MPARSAETPAGLIWDRISGGSARSAAAESRPDRRRDDGDCRWRGYRRHHDAPGRVRARVTADVALPSHPKQGRPSRPDPRHGLRRDHPARAALGRLAGRPSAYCAGTRALLLHHPWLAGLLSSRPPLGPNYLRYFEFCLAAIAVLHVDMRMTVQIFGTGLRVCDRFCRIRGGRSRDCASYGSRPTLKNTPSPGHTCERLIATGDYPQFARFFEAGAVPGDEDPLRIRAGVACWTVSPRACPRPDRA